jgi:hypoxanthine phosphoribosyltransferase
MTAGGADRALGRRIYEADEIRAAVERMAREVAADYRGRPIVLLGVLKGALYLTVDLGRALAELPDGPSEIFIDYVSVTRYGTSSTTRARPRLLLDPQPFEGRDILIIEDIADNGLTLRFLQSLLKERGPASVRTCVLLDKSARRQVDVPLNYVGLPAPDAFVVGYGLDYQEQYRNLPYLAELTAEAMRRL